MQKARRHIIQDAPTACRRTVSGTLSLPCKGSFSPFPHGTGSLSVSYEYLALPDGPGGFTQDYSCPALLRSPLRFRLLRVRGCHPLWRGFPVASTHGLSCDGAVLQPRRCRDNVGLGSSPVARHYWGNHSLFSFPAGTVSVPRVRLPHRRDNISSRYWVVPFGDPRVKGHLRLTAAFRSLSRPSSPVRA